MSQTWIVARTKSQRERWAAENVARQGYDFYLPVLPPQPAPKSRKARPPQFLFPGYLFVQTDGQWRFLLGTFGITTIIMTGQHPSFMPETEIARLRARENDSGFIQLPQLTTSRFRNGDSVRITEGSFSGLKGIYECDPEQERVRVLLDFLGRKTPILIADDCLEPAES